MSHGSSMEGFSHYGKIEVKTAASVDTAALRAFTWCGARVGPHQSSILRPSGYMLSCDGVVKPNFVVVSDVVRDDRARSFHDRWLEDFSGMQQRCVQCSGGDFVDARPLAYLFFTKRCQNRPSGKLATSSSLSRGESGSQACRGPSPAVTASDPAAAREGEVVGKRKRSRVFRTKRTISVGI